MKEQCSDVLPNVDSIQFINSINIAKFISYDMNNNLYSTSTIQFKFYSNPTVSVSVILLNIKCLLNVKYSKCVSHLETK